MHARRFTLKILRLYNLGKSFVSPDTATAEPAEPAAPVTAQQPPVPPANNIQTF